MLDQNPCVTLKQLTVNGRDMASLGLKGPQIGAMLTELLSAVIDGALPNDREALMRRAQHRITEENTGRYDA